MHLDYRVIGALIITWLKCDQSGVYIGAKNVEQVRWRISVMAAPSLQVKLDFKELRSTNEEIQKAAERAVRLAVNETANNAKSEAIKQTARDYGIAQQFVRYRWSSRLAGGKPVKTGERMKIIKASRNNYSASIKVHLRGLPISVIAGKQIKQAKGWNKGAQKRGTRQAGVKAKGGRFYRQAFKDSSGRVWKRRDSGKGIMMPKLGLRDDLIGEFDALIFGPRAQARFQRVYDRILKAKLKPLKRGAAEF